MLPKKEKGEKLGDVCSKVPAQDEHCFEEIMVYPEVSGTELGEYTLCGMFQPHVTNPSFQIFSLYHSPWSQAEKYFEILQLMKVQRKKEYLQQTNGLLPDMSKFPEHGVIQEVGDLQNIRRKFQEKTKY